MLEVDHGKTWTTGLPEAERRRVWDLWKQGHTFGEISRRVGSPPGSIFSILRTKGDIYFPEPRPGANALSLAEREENSRGLAASKSIRAIASELGRARQLLAEKSATTRAVKSIE